MTVTTGNRHPGLSQPLLGTDDMNNPLPLVMPGSVGPYEQRAVTVAIARAMLKNAPILILDEATSQLDSVTEQEIQESLWSLMQGKTTLVIAHRLSTLLHMDRILVFEQGKIVADGRHADLLAQGGLYKSLWTAQVAGFLPDNKNTGSIN